MNELTVLDNLPTAIQIFASGAAEDFLNQIKEECAKFVPDISTEKGRKEIASRAYKISQAKTKLDDLGKELTEEEKKKIDAVNKERRRLWDELEALQRQVRAPLTEYEEKEKQRVKTLQSHLDMLQTYHEFPADYTADEIKKRLAALQDGEIDTGIDWAEFSMRAEAAKKTSIENLQAAYNTKLKADADAERLAELERKESERLQKERDDKIASDAAAEAKRIADEAAAIEQNRLKKEKEDAEARALKSETDRIAAKQKADDDARLAEEKAAADLLKAQEDAQKSADAAVKAEQDRVAKEAKEKADDDAKRNADKEHRAKINNEVLEAMGEFVAASSLSGTLKDLVIAIAKGEIPYVKITY